MELNYNKPSEMSQSSIQTNKRLPSYEQFLLFTELSVNLANEAVDKELGRIDMFTASDFLIKRELETEAMLTGLMYIHKYKNRKKTGQIRKGGRAFTSADLFLVSMMLASKYLFDNGTTENVVNEEWAEDAGIDTEEINELEVEMLNQLDWRLHVFHKDYVQFYTNVRSHLAYRHWQNHKLSGSTYWQMIAITDKFKIDEKFMDFITNLCKILVTCAVVYVSVLVGLNTCCLVVYRATVCGSGNGSVDTINVINSNVSVMIYKRQHQHYPVNDNNSNQLLFSDKTENLDNRNRKRYNYGTIWATRNTH